jgi:hypothetical protein
VVFCGRRRLGPCPVGFVRVWLRELPVKEELGIPGTHQPVFPIVAWLQSPAGPA